jgi:peptide/nickel transport system substrate-binding protein
LAEDIVRTRGLTLKPVVIDSPFWLYFPEQWDAKSPWQDVRVRQAAALALDMKAINEALTLGHSRLTNSMFPDSFDFYWQPPAMVYDPVKAKRLLAEAGHPNGFDAGDYFCDISYANLGETVLDNLQAVGIRARLRPSERAAFIQGISDKIYKNIVQIGSGAFGNVAIRFESWIVKGGPSCSRCRSSCTNWRSRPRSGSSPSSTARARAWANRRSGRSRASRTRLPMRIRR